MNIAGIDYSSRAVDLVTIHTDTGHTEWHHYPLTGADAFDRTRTLPDTFPTRYSVWWDDILAVGIEEPRGHNTGPLYRVQGAILACIPPRMLVVPWIPSSWRKAVGLPGNASKDTVAFFAANDCGGHEFRDWSQDACDAYCVALATLSAVRDGTPVSSPSPTPAPSPPPPPTPSPAPSPAPPTPTPTPPTKGP